MIRVFVRNWWKWETNSLGMKKKVPNPTARKTTLCHVNTVEEARKICEEWNRNNNPGPLSRKAEFTRE